MTTLSHRVASYLYLSTNCWNFILTGYPDWRILIVSNIPAYLNCSSTTGMSKRMGLLSLLGLMQRINQGLQRDIDSRSCCKLSLKRAATVGVLGFIVTKRPLLPLGRVRVCAWLTNGLAIAATKGSLLEDISSTTSGLRTSRFLSRKPSTEYHTWPAKCFICKNKSRCSFV